jgi:hypothetical protein
MGQTNAQHFSHLHHEAFGSLIKYSFVAPFCFQHLSPKETLSLSNLIEESLLQQTMDEMHCKV